MSYENEISSLRAKIAQIQQEFGDMETLGELKAVVRTLPIISDLAWSVTYLMLKF